MAWLLRDLRSFCSGGSSMKRWLSEALFWAAIGFVGCSFLLGGIGVEISAGPQAELTLQWHKAFGLLSLLATVAAAIGFIYSKRRLSAPFRFWTLWFRTPISVLLYVLLILQPVSGWLLASLQGKLTTIFGFQPSRACDAQRTAFQVCPYVSCARCRTYSDHRCVELGANVGCLCF